MKSIDPIGEIESCTIINIWRRKSMLTQKTSMVFSKRLCGICKMTMVSITLFIIIFFSMDILNAQAKNSYIVRFCYGMSREEILDRHGAICYLELHFDACNASHVNRASVGLRSEPSDIEKAWGSWYLKKISESFNIEVSDRMNIPRISKRLTVYDMPAICLEPCFITNPGGSKLAKEKKEELAKIIAEGICIYFPQGGIVALSMGHEIGIDVGAISVDGDKEAVLAEDILNIAKKILEDQAVSNSGASPSPTSILTSTPSPSKQITTPITDPKTHNLILIVIFAIVSLCTGILILIFKKDYSDMIIACSFFSLFTAVITFGILNSTASVPWQFGGAITGAFAGFVITFSLFRKSLSTDKITVEGVIYYSDNPIKRATVRLLCGSFGDNSHNIEENMAGHFAIREIPFSELPKRGESLIFIIKLDKGDEYREQIDKWNIENNVIKVSNRSAPSQELLNHSP
ncbi:MAG: hypothetical protein AB2L14_11885 [Candidatus Xenobiia bacterium LiM19]